MLSVAMWTKEKQHDLFQTLTGYWTEDIWDLPSCPIKLPFGKLGRTRFLKFVCPSPNVNAELKFVCRNKIIEGDWKIASGLQGRMSSLMEWMKSCLPATTRSLMERPLHEWEESYCSFRIAKGHRIVQKKKCLMASQQFKESTQVCGDISFLRTLYQELEKTYDTRTEYEKDVWDFRQLGIRVSSGKANFKANFTFIQQTWLRQIAKTCLRYRLLVYSSGDCSYKLSALNVFSDFLVRHHPTAGPADISRAMMIDFFGFLQARRISPSTRAGQLISLRTIFELAVRMGWGDGLPKSRIIFDDDLPQQTKQVPRFIPEQVFQQIFLCLDQLEPKWQRMFLVAYEVGMRISELLELSFNCLMQDATGGWWIHYFQGKVRTEQTQPILPETAAVIQAQQQEVQAQFGHLPELLFPDPKGKCHRAILFRNAINLFIIQNNIRDASGALWRFQPHQLRHSFATRHINNGMPILTLQRLMGHRGVEMTETYAQLHEQTMRVKFEQARQDHKLVDISGRVIAENSPLEATDLQWLKSQVEARTLANGYCGIPMVLGPCPHPNSCLTCQHFRTDSTHLPTHETQLVETIRLIEVARSKGWETQAENNERIARNLQTIIASLKRNNDEPQPQG